MRTSIRISNIRQKKNTIKQQEIIIIKHYFQKTSITKKPSIISDKDVPHNMGRKDVIRATDFNFLMVLGKGSFGKVRS